MRYALNTDTIKIRRRNRRYQPRLPKIFYRTNHRIVAPNVRVVGEGVEAAVYPLQEAISLAKSKGLDLVEIYAKDEIPVCKIVDYQKFLYRCKKKEKLKLKANKTVLKTVRFGAKIDPHDFQIKQKSALKFLEEGYSVKLHVQFRGYLTMTQRNIAKNRLADFIKSMEEQGGKIKQDMKLERRQMFAIIDPVKKKKADTKAEKNA